MPAAVLPAGPVALAHAGYDVRFDRDWDRARPDFEAAFRTGRATPFQDGLVLSSWYGAMSARPDVEPLLVSVRDVRTGEAALHLPLIRRRRGLVRVIGFADLDLVDYNAPILGPAAPRTQEGAAALWRALRRGLPGSDLISLRKMPPEIDGQPNPLALVATLPSELNGNLVRIGDDYEAYMRGGIKRVVRKELERSWRVFSRQPGTAFRTVVGREERRRVLAAIELQQPIRMERVGKRYGLDAPEAADVYRRLVDADPDGQNVGLLALMAGDEVVAALMGLRSGRSFTMIRISSSADPVWTNASPGRLVIERTMASLHDAGVRDFDFSVGNYDYKRRFGVVPTPLVDVVRATSPLGLAEVGRLNGRAWLRQRPELEARLRRAFGRAHAQEMSR